MQPPELTNRYRIVTPWGEGVVGVRQDAIIEVWPPDNAPDPAPEGLPSALDPDAPAFVRELAAALVAYLEGRPVDLAPREDVVRWLDAAQVTGFRRDVSLALLDVPPGVTLSYGELAALAGRPGAARAAGSACARNPLPLVVPCHRVVHAGARRGQIGSYGGGLSSDRGPAYKRRLLELEGAELVRVAPRGS